MTQVPRLTRARQLTASVWPGRTDGSPSPGVTRLRKLAAARSSGTLPFPGVSEGAVYLRHGQVAAAECLRTPGPGQAGSLPDSADPVGRLSAALAATEPTLDALLELLSAGGRPARFRSAPGPAAVAGHLQLPVDGLLAEVARRQRLLRQLAPVLTADTVVVRCPATRSPQIRVSATQWAVLIRVRDGATPRELAWQLRRSVFGTTTEIYRLLALRLLSVPGWAGPGPGARRPIMSFTRAVSHQEGDEMPDDFSIRPAAGSDL
jgi:hypothetical protein